MVSKLARKVDGYATYTRHLQENNKTQDRKYEANVPVLTQIQNFLATLVNPSDDGRFFWSKGDGTILLRYMLLDPSEHFRDIVEGARYELLHGRSNPSQSHYTENKRDTVRATQVEQNMRYAEKEIRST